MGLAEQIQAGADNAVCFTPTRFTTSEWLVYGLLPNVFMQIRSFAAVIFRRISSKTRKTDTGNNVDMFYSLVKDQAIVIRQKLLETLGSETDRAVRNKISDAVAEVARQYTDNSQSP